MTPLGLILTSAPSADPLGWLRAQLRAAGSPTLKVVPAWGWPGGWSAEAIRQVAALAPLVVRTSWGDPSYRGHNDANSRYPLANRVLAELAPWLDVAPESWVELGNEPLHQDEPTDEPAHIYAWHLGEAITAIRERWPRARLIAPAHIRNHPIRLGAHADGQAQWDRICGPQLRRCDALGLHAYSVPQAVAGLSQLRSLVSGSMPIWLTEFALNEQLAPAERGRRYRAVLADLPVAAALIYHLDTQGGTDPAHFRPEYRLEPATLAALAQEAPAVPAPATTAADTVHYPNVRLDRFVLDVRQWRTVAAFRAHLARHAYAQTAPWARGVVVHHSVSPTAASWKGEASILAMARFYRDEVDNGPGKPKGGWTTGPHIFIVSGSPDPTLDGIWQLSPLNVPGTHARAANPTRWGLEWVGNYSRTRWPPDLAALGLGAAAALLDWAGLPADAETVSPHSQWGKPECPGGAIDMAAVRRGVAALQQRAR